MTITVVGRWCIPINLATYWWLKHYFCDQNKDKNHNHRKKCPHKKQLKFISQTLKRYMCIKSYNHIYSANSCFFLLSLLHREHLFRNIIVSLHFFKTPEKGKAQRDTHSNAISLWFGDFHICCYQRSKIFIIALWSNLKLKKARDEKGNLQCPLHATAWPSACSSNWSSPE